MHNTFSPFGWPMPHISSLASSAIAPRYGLLLALIVFLAACTGGGGPEPDPTPTPTATTGGTAPPITGPRIAIVRAPGANEIGGGSTAATAIERLRGAYADQLSEVRDVVAEPVSFMPDVVALLADQGYDLVCAVGSPALESVLAAAAEYPRTHFCVLPAVHDDPPANVLVLDLNVEEAAFVAGGVAVRLAPEAPPGLVGARAVYAVDRRRAGFRAGVDHARAELRQQQEATEGTEGTEGPPGTEEDGPPTPEVLIGLPASDVEAASSLATAQFEAGAEVVYTVAGAADPGVLAAAEQEQRAVIGDFPAGESDQAEPPSAWLFGLRPRLESVLQIAVDRQLGEWSNTAVAVGLADDAFELVSGGHRRGTAATRIAREFAAGIANGEVAVPTP